MKHFNSGIELKEDSNCSFKNLWLEARCSAFGGRKTLFPADTGGNCELADYTD